MNNYKNLDILRNSKSICLIGHINPDPDALSSMIVFKDFIKTHFKIECVDIFSETTEISEPLSLILEDTKINNQNTAYDTAIMMDCPNTDRLGKYKSLFEDANIKIVIDHHSTNNFDGQINIVEFVSSTCEIVYSILRHFDYKLTSANKGKLYAGIITDTNNFSVGTINKRTFEIAGDLVDSINREEIYKTFLANTTLKKAQLLSIAIQNIKSYCNNQIIITNISHETAKSWNAKTNDFCGITNQIASISSAKLVCFIEPRDNIFYVSMRAKNGYNVSEIAKSHGGGGHIGAAAFSSSDSIENIENLILNDFTKQLSSVKTTKRHIF